MKNNFLKNVLKILILIILSPVIIISIVVVAPVLLFDYLKEPSRKREYMKSQYYLDFHIPYRRHIQLEDSYQFYNEAKNANLDFQIIHPDDDNPEFVIFKNKVYLFPMHSDIFYGIFYSDTDKEWKVSLDEEWFSLDDEWNKYKAYVEKANGDMPCFLMVMQDDLHPRDETYSDDFAMELLPPYVCIVEHYTDVLRQ